MTNKQIIIDGVDVSGCCWCVYEPDEDPYCQINDGEDLGCEDNPNCYYKQLKRTESELACKEQKLAKIKEILEIHKDNKCVTCQKFDKCFEQPSCDNVILQIIEGKDNE